ncbi:hypothetical protein ND00_18700 [Clostridium sp. L74]|nr:hypothetical protein ND00_18700 [Clostridium sp. L74]
MSKTISFITFDFQASQSEMLFSYSFLGGVQDTITNIKEKINR